MYDKNAAHLVHEADKLWHTHLASLQCLSVARLYQNSQIFSTVSSRVGCDVSLGVSQFCISHSMALACFDRRMCSRVWAIGPSGEEITRIPPSIWHAPRTLVAKPLSRIGAGNRDPHSLLNCPHTNARPVIMFLT